MQLEKVKRRNFKKIGIAIFTIACVLLIAWAFIFSSFASFEAKETRAFINGNVVDPGDISFSFYVDGVITRTIPSKNAGYIFEKGNCTNGASVEWLNDEWPRKFLILLKQELNARCIFEQKRQWTLF